jgi:hypothetical protein
MIVLKAIHVPYAPPDTIKTSSSYLVSESKIFGSVPNRAAKTWFEYALKDPKNPMCS